MKTIILQIVFTVAVVQGHTQILKGFGKKVISDVEWRVRQKAADKAAQGVDSMLNKVDTMLNKKSRSHRKIRNR